MMNFYTVIVIMLDNLGWEVKKYAVNIICWPLAGYTSHFPQFKFHGSHMAEDKM